MSLAPESIQAAIAELEARSRDFETRAGECRETAATLRRLFDVSTLTPPIGNIPNTDISNRPRHDMNRTTAGTEFKGRPGKPAAGPSSEKPAVPPPQLPTGAVHGVAAKPRAWKGEKSVDQASRRAIVLAAVRKLGTPSRRGVISERVPEIGDASISAVLSDLAERGELIRAGTKSTTVYSLPAAGSTKQPPARADDLKTTENAALAQAVRREGLADVLEHFQTHAAAAFTHAEIRRAVDLTKGELDAILTGLLRARQVIPLDGKHGQPRRYRLATAAEQATRPTARSITVPDSIDPHALAQKITQIFSSGASYDVRDILRNCRGTFPSVDEALIAKVVDGLFGAGQLQRIPMGSTVRYQRVVKARQQEIA